LPLPLISIYLTFRTLWVLSAIAVVGFRVDADSAVQRHIED